MSGIMITGAQIRMATAALGWNMSDVARESGLGWRTVQRIAAVDGVPPGRATSLAAIQAAFERAGIQFQEPDNGGPGVRLVKPPKPPVRPRIAKAKRIKAPKRARKQKAE